VGAEPEILREQFEAVSQTQLVTAVFGLTQRAVHTAHQVPSLRVYRVDQGEAEIVMLVNESVRDTVSTTLTLPRPGQAVEFDAFTGKCTSVPSRGDDITLVDINLAPGAAAVLVVGSPTAWSGLDLAPRTMPGKRRKLETPWAISTCTAENYPAFTPWSGTDKLVPLSAPDLLPRFSGTLLYTASFAADQPGGACQIDLGEVYEIAQVRVNGVDLGTRIAPPYFFAIEPGLLLAENNALEIEVTNTLAKAQPDAFSAFAQQEPTGLLGPVTLIELNPVDAASEIEGQGK
jgi:hypothetical protein